MIKSTPSVCDRVLLGGVLALLYSRGRASNGDRTVRVIWDVVDESLMDRIDGPPGFIELASVGKQGCEDVEVAQTVVATHHSYGQFSGVPWWDFWAKSRNGRWVSRATWIFLCCRASQQKGSRLEEHVRLESCSVVFLVLSTCQEMWSEVTASRLPFLAGWQNADLRCTCADWQVII